MKKAIIIYIVITLIMVTGCNNVSKHKEAEGGTEATSVSTLSETELQSQMETEQNTEKETATEKETEKEPQIYVLGNQQIECLEAMKDIFSDVRVTTQKDATQWVNSYATASLNVVGGELDSPNCMISYSSSLGSVDGLDVCMSVSNYNHWNTDYYEVDVTNDGYKDLVIVYVWATGTGCMQKGITVYDFKTETQINPVGKDNICFSSKQESAIIDFYKKCNEEGHSEIIEGNRGQLDTLYYESFIPTIVQYNGQSCIRVYAYEAMTSGEACNNYINVVLIYKNGSFEIDAISVKNIENTNF